MNIEFSGAVCVFKSYIQKNSILAFLFGESVGVADDRGNLKATIYLNFYKSKPSLVFYSLCS